MSTIYTIPSYLPKGLSDHVKPQFKNDQALDVIYPLERLITYPSMRNVWTKLITFCPETAINKKDKDFHEIDYQPLIDFLVFVNGHSSLAGQFDDYITQPSDKVQRKAYHSIQKDLESIVTTLQSLSEIKTPRNHDSTTDTLKQGSIQQGWNLLEEATCRSSCNTLQSPKYKNTKQLSELILELNNLNEQYGIQDILESMTFAAIAASKAKDSNLPKRRNTPNAKINRFVLDLSNYFISHFKQPFDDLVAITTNTAFDFDDENISENAVYKLRTATSKPKSKLKPT